MVGTAGRKRRPRFRQGFHLKSRIVIVVLVLVILVQAAFILFGIVRSGWRDSVHDNPIERGREVAERMGCFGCHGPGGESPSPNPGAAHGEVPRWGGGTWMMWNDNVADIRAWITDGHPPTRSPDRDALIPMPAYGPLLKDVELDDLVAYVLSVSRFGRPTDPEVVAGRETAARLGCFGCHGPEGRGQLSNPRSFRGYIPPWDGPDYPDLVRSDEEFRQWVRNGVCDRLDHPASRLFLDRQAIGMPAYGEHVSDEQLNALLAYVNWIQQNRRTPVLRE